LRGRHDREPAARRRERGDGRGLALPGRLPRSAGRGEGSRRHPGLYEARADGRCQAGASKNMRAYEIVAMNRQRVKGTRRRRLSRTGPSNSTATTCWCTKPASRASGLRISISSLSSTKFVYGRPFFAVEFWGSVCFFFGGVPPARISRNQRGRSTQDARPIAEHQSVKCRCFFCLGTEDLTPREHRAA